MGDSLRRLCTICARGGSKGVPGKNLRSIAGRPLVAHTVDQAVRSGLFSHIAISSDDDNILETAMSAGATLAIKRPADLATDEAGKIPAILHAVQTAETTLGQTFSILTDLDATSPLRHVDDIVGAVSLAEKSGVANVITGSPARRSPYFNLVEKHENGCVTLSKPLPKAVLRRQDAPACFDMNASVYVWRRSTFLSDPRVFYDDTLLYEMPEVRSHDIDTELDFAIVKFLMGERNND